MRRRLYSEEAAREILKRAATLDTEESDFTGEQLEALARELVISEDALSLAEKEWRAGREWEMERVANEEAQQTLSMERRRYVLQRIATLGTLALSLLLLNLAIVRLPPGTWWLSLLLAGVALLLTSLAAHTLIRIFAGGGGGTPLK